MGSTNIVQRTRQEAFDLVVKGLLTQREKCMTGFSCVYENVMGHHCAIGFLLPENSEYLKHIGNVDSLLAQYPELIPSFGYLDESELIELQIIHDNRAIVLWESLLKAFAEEHYLEFNPPMEVQV